MKFSVMLAVVALAGCASKATNEPPVEQKVRLDASNIVEAQKAGYKMVDKDGKKLYCKRDLKTGSHARYTTTCLTEQEWREIHEVSKRGIEAMRRTQPPAQGN